MAKLVICEIRGKKIIKELWLFLHLFIFKYSDTVAHKGCLQCQVVSSLIIHTYHGANVSNHFLEERGSIYGRHVNDRQERLNSIIIFVGEEHFHLLAQ